MENQLSSIMLVLL